MKRILLLLLISLCQTMWSFSQNSYPKIINDSIIAITAQQLKQTNLIFLKYDALKIENTSLNIQVTDLKKIYQDELVIDSLYEEHIELLNESLNKSNELINKNQKTITHTKNWLKASVFINIVGIVCLLL